MRSWRVALASTLHASGGSAYRAYVRVAADETTAAQPPTDRPFELVPWKVLPVFAHGRSRPPVSHPHALPAGAPCEISTTTPSGRECQLAFQSSAPQAWEYDAEAPPRHPLRRTPMVEDLTCRCGFGCRGPARGEGVGGVAAEVRGLGRSAWWCRGRRGGWRSARRAADWWCPRLENIAPAAIRSETRPDT